MIRPINYIRVNKTGKAHIHKVILNECATSDIPYIISPGTVLLYDPHLSLEKLLASIDVLRDKIQLRTQEGEPK